MFKFYLDNALVSDPINWADFTETIERDNVIKGLLPKYELKLNFSGGGYKCLYDILNSDGFCKLVRLRVEYKCADVYDVILNGYIFISDCKFNLNKCIVECSVEDDNFGARIFNNKTIPVYLDSEKTKNNQVLVPCESLSVQLFNPVTGAYGGFRTVYKVYDCFRYLIDFMTDNLVGFESDYFSGNEINNLTIAAGIGIRTSASPVITPFISFKELFEEINKKYPIIFTIVTGSDGRPTVKIEDENYFYNSTSSIAIPNIQDMELSFNSEELFSSVRIGGTATEIDPNIHHFGYIQLLSFKEEQYFFQGECNIDKTLDLVGLFISDTNIIEEIFVVGTNTTWDANVFFIQTDGVDKAVGYNNPITLGLPYYYNYYLTNDKVAGRYSYNGNLTLYLSGVFNSFLANNTTPQCEESTGQTTGIYNSATFVATFPNEAYDYGNNFDGTKYTASADGVYQFKTEQNFHVYDTDPPQSDHVNSQSIIFIIRMNRYNSSNVLIEYREFSYGDFVGTYSTQGYYNFSNNYGIFTMATNDYVNVTVSYSYKIVGFALIRYNLDAANFRTIAAPTSGGVYQQSNAASYFVSKIEFERPLPYSDYKTLKLDLSKGLTVNHDGQQDKTGWIRKLVRKPSTGETKWELISNINNSQ